MNFRNNAGVSICIFLACNIHCVSNGVGRRRNSSSVLIKWVPLVVLSGNKVPMIGDLVQS